MSQEEHTDNEIIMVEIISSSASHKFSNDSKTERVLEEKCVTDVVIVALLVSLIWLTFAICVVMTRVRDDLEIRQEVCDQIFTQMMINARENQRMMRTTLNLQKNYEVIIVEAKLMHM